MAKDTADNDEGKMARSASMRTERRDVPLSIPREETAPGRTGSERQEEKMKESLRIGQSRSISECRSLSLSLSVWMDGWIDSE